MPAEKSVPVATVDLADGHGLRCVANLRVSLSLLLTLRSCVRSRAALQLEVLALRHQLQVLQRSRPRRLRLAQADRLLWVWRSNVWTEWRAALVIVKPETVIGLEFTRPLGNENGHSSVIREFLKLEERAR